VYDFGTSTNRHGIVRTLPVRYQNSWATLYGLRLNVSAVTVDGTPVAVHKSTLGNSIELRVGDEQTIVTGTHMYLFAYSVDRALLTRGDRAELAWNAIGSDWEVPIVSSSIVLRLPKTSVQSSKVTCVVGEKNSSEPCHTFSQVDTIFRFDPERRLAPGTAVTISASLPASSFTPVSSWRRTWLFFQDNFVLFSPFFVGIVCWGIWFRYGRDARGRETIIAQYEPPQASTSLEIGTMIDQHVDERDIASLFISWAVQGSIRIHEVPGKKLSFEFEKMHEPATFATPQERALFDLLFAAGTRYRPQPDSKVYTAIQELKNATYQLLVKKGLFTVHPDVVRTAFFVAGGVIGFGGGLFFAAVVYPESFFAVIAFMCMVLSGGIIALTGRVMPQVTSTGAELVEHIAGFKLFLSVTEAARLKFFNAPDKTPEQFEKYLPYAIALEVEKEWAAQFASMHIPPPEWYHSTTQSVFVPSVFAKNLTQITDTVRQYRTPTTPSSFGSVSAGGGFGGGGGRSW
jgi:hypothetical protein